MSFARSSFEHDGGDMTKALSLCALVLWALPVKAFDWQGHRGARGIYPENTIQAMRDALKYSAITTLELDVVISKDAQVVVSHEPWMAEEICLDPQGKPVVERAVNLYQLNYEQIAQYDCGSKTHPRFPEQRKVKEQKPLLGQLLTTVERELARSGRKIEYNIEIKSTLEDEKAGFQPPVKDFVELVVKEIGSKLPLNRVYLQSFDWRVLQYLHKHHPSVRTVALIEEGFRPEDVLTNLGFKPAVFSPYFKNLTAEHVKFFHQKGIKVIPWTVNEVSDMEQVKKWGVDGVITDYPNRIKP